MDSVTGPPTTGLVAIDDSRRPIVRATLSCPATRNRLDEPMVAQLMGALDQAERTSDAELFVLDAIGDTFCVGISLDDLGDVDWRPRITAIHGLLTRLAESSLVTIAVVDQPAIGGGVGLAAACDHVIAGPRASFRMTELLLGLVPAAILPLIVRRVGSHRAYSLALTSRELSSRQAARVGLADQWTDQPTQELRRLLVRLRAVDHAAVRALKRYRTELFAAPEDHEELMMKVLEERLADPRVRLRLKDFQAQGLIP